VVDWIKNQQISFDSFDLFYESGAGFNQIYEAMAGKVLEAVVTGPVVYAVPGHPLVAETAVEIILREADRLGIFVEIVPAMSFLDAVYAVLRIDPVKGMQIVDGLRLDTQPTDPALGAVVVQVYSRLVAGDIKLALLELYPAEHQGKFGIDF